MAFGNYHSTEPFFGNFRLDLRPRREDHFLIDLIGDEKERNETDQYLHLTLNNSTYALIDKFGKIRLNIQFRDCTGPTVKPTKVIPETLEAYSQLMEQLTNAGIEFERDLTFERSIKDLASKLS